jgi:divalent metal cation (Fe/Co/Zn/Cd) transporter
MDAVDPALLARAEMALAETPGVLSVGQLRLRWIGHRLHAEGDLVVPADLTLAHAHHLAVAAELHLKAAISSIAAVTLHADPAPCAGRRHHSAVSSSV